MFSGTPVPGTTSSASTAPRIARSGLVRSGLSRLAMVALGACLLWNSPAMAEDITYPRGSVVGLVPPAGMVESNQFSGFESEKLKASILIVDLPPEAYPQVEAGFTDAALAAKGIRVTSRAPFKLQNMPDAKAVLISGTQTAGPLTAHKWILLVGTDMLTSLVTVQSANGEGDKLNDGDVRAALSTLSFRSPQDQVAALPFTMKDLAGFRVLRTLGGSTAILTDGPDNILEGAKQPFFVISVAPGAPREDERKQFSIRALATVPGLKDVRIERAEPLRINQVRSFEIMADAVDAKTGEPVKVVQWIRFGQTGHLRMVAVTRKDDFPQLYPRLRALRDGVDGR